ncbi:hypothetical protein CA850_29605 [Micromonospora echinospora]|uniref:Uncharacterized protein n=1 Tax=Micromonospora echinospora TaxID=1877 RepID=A0A1C5ABJ0_MICEC|nr:hypothetical protein [Micromonospora echinospora]OZV74736.1 hypothetical protein CA850_29605 [Micromonospora echinospora]SCE66641.1 hypothetical protein GA0070618_0012 [Micromonospora echinospora]SCF42583.1 hypothetical protein GA0070618_6682 [Micromonospora echinospora]
MSPLTITSKGRSVTVTRETVPVGFYLTPRPAFVITTPSGFRATLPECYCQLDDQPERTPCNRPAGHAVPGPTRNRDEHYRTHCHSWHPGSAERFARDVLAASARPATRKPSASKPAKSDLSPGTRVTWAHIAPDGTEVKRAGVVWANAPRCNGSETVWVTPDTPDPADVYPAAVPVVRARKGSRIYVGRTWSSEWSPCGGRQIEPGELFSETGLNTDTAKVAQVAARHAATLRAQRHDLAA